MKYCLLLLWAGIAMVQPSFAQTKSSTAPAAVSKVIYIPDPNLPRQSGEAVFSGSIDPFTWAAPKRNQPRGQLAFRSSDGTETIGTYLGMDNTGQGSPISYVSLNGTIFKLDPAHGASKINPADLPANLVNSAISKQIYGSTAVLPALPPGIDSSYKETAGNSNQVLIARSGLVAIAGTNVTIKPKAGKSGFYTLTYPDPTTKKTVAVEIKRIFTADQVTSLKSYTPEQLKMLMARGDASGTIVGDFVKVPISKIAQNYTHYLISRGNELIVIPEADVMQIPTTWPLDWQATQTGDQ